VASLWDTIYTGSWLYSAPVLAAFLIFGLVSFLRDRDDD
jgi:hypothetical protein